MAKPNLFKLNITNIKKSDSLPADPKNKPGPSSDDDDSPPRHKGRPLSATTLKEFDSIGIVPFVKLKVKKKDNRVRYPPTSFRCIPLQLKYRINEFSRNQQIPAGIAARLFLVRGLEAYKQGRLIIVPKVGSGGLTLYPELNHRVGRTPKMSPAEIGKNKKKSTREKSSDIFSFRGLPPEIYNQLQSIALNEIKVSVGDLARRLFEYGLESYDNGNLNIDQKEIIDWISEINSPVKTKKD